VKAAPLAILASKVEVKRVEHDNSQTGHFSPMALRSGESLRIEVDLILSGTIGSSFAKKLPVSLHRRLDAGYR
jgi:hypothetical protein